MPVSVATGPRFHVMRWTLRPFTDGLMQFDYRCLGCGLTFNGPGFDATPSATFHLHDIWNPLYATEESVRRQIGDDICKGWA